MAITADQVLNSLRSVQDPDLKQDLVSLGFIKNLQLGPGGRVAFAIELTTPACPVRDLMKAEAERAVKSIPGVTGVEIAMTSQVRPSVRPQAASGASLIPTIKHVIPIASGKGGVGKSTVTANLAHALRRDGAAVGIMDADVYGPSIPTIMGVGQAPEVDEQNRITPVEQDGIKVISMGFFMRPDEAVVWRGPMLHKTVQQFLGGVIWGDLDYLLVDLPPGTGDVQLSLCQSIPITGAVIVSTPQDVALNVAQKAITMFRKLNAPVLGIIENMSHFECSQCHHTEEIFGSGGARRIAESLKIPLLGQIPLVTAVRAGSDAGHPIVATDPGSPAGQAFIKAAQQMAAQVSILTMRGELHAPVKVTF
jgi:ATP-binding protein involved in chromosome partitioning